MMMIIPQPTFFFSLFLNMGMILLLLQNPDIVLVHYLNVPYPDDAKLLVVASVSLWAERKEWSKEELISQLRPMCKEPHFSLCVVLISFSALFFLSLCCSPQPG